MNFLKITAFILIVAIGTSCTKDEGQVYSNQSIALTAAQVVPPSTSTATGTMSVSYNTKTKTMAYTVSWSNLSGNPTGIHIHGLADAGTVAVPNTVGGSYPNGIAQTISISGQQASGSLTGTLYADGVVIREEDLLAGKFYLDIHTAAQPNGAIRGQITFNQ